MRGVILVLVVMAATLVSASGVALAVGVGTSGARSPVVGPGESIQKAVNAAHPGDKIVVKGVHKEDVVIRKDGIKLLGDDAVIEAPPKSNADSLCSKGFEQPIGICVLGGEDLKVVKLTGPRVSDVSISGFTLRGFKKAPSICLCGTRDSTATKNRALDTGFIAAEFSVGTKIIHNVMRGPGNSGIGVHKGRDITVEATTSKAAPTSR